MPGVKPRSQDRAVAHAVVQRPCERRDGLSPVVRAEGRVSARLDLRSTTRAEEVVAQHDVLTRNVRLVSATPVVTADNARVGRRPLRPVDPAVFEGDLFGRVVAGRQAADEWGNFSARGVHDHDAGAVVLCPRRANRLVRVRSEEPPARKTLFERDVDRWSVR